MLRRIFGILSAALLLSGAAFPGPATEEAPVPLPILMYHDVKETKPGKDRITPYELESDLRYLLREGYTPVAMAEVAAYVYDGVPLPPKPIVLSFDDGLLSVYTTVGPLLEKYGMKIVLSAIGRSADEFSALPAGDPRYAHATWSQLRELRDRGLAEIQNHSYDLHRDEGGMLGCQQRPGESGADYARRLSEDLTRMQERAFAELGTVPDTFAYPYGKYSALSEGVLRELGFRASLTCDFGMNLLTRDPDCLMGMKRICRSHGASLPALLDEANESLKWR